MPALASPLAPCRHCGRLRSAARMKRGLCRGPTCHPDPAVRALYPHDPDGPFKHLGTENPHARDFPGAGRRPPRPTAAAPGSPEKIAALAERVRLGQRLHRRGDASNPLPFEKSRSGPGGARPWEFAMIWRLLGAQDPSLLRDLKELLEDSAPRESPALRGHLCAG